MTAPRLAIADELAAIRAEIARLKHREKTLASIGRAFPVVPAFRQGWPVQRKTQTDPTEVAANT